MLNSYKISDIKMPIDYSADELKRTIERAIGATVSNIRLLKKSIDARKKPQLWYVISAAFSCAACLTLEPAPPLAVDLDSLVLPLYTSAYSGRVAIIGSGPAGLFAGLLLAKSGVKVDIYERGGAVENRQKSVLTFQKSGELDENSNIQFGEGGAGTFSDGKLNTGIKSEYINCVLGEFVKHGADEDITYSAKPHIGTDVLKRVVVSMRKEILSLGSNVKFCSRVDDITIKGGAIVGLNIGGNLVEYDRVILACGHSARDTYKMLAGHGVEMQSKAFAIGARIEHEQQLIDTAQYGKSMYTLPPSDYKLSATTKDGRGCYTFCMCPGGEIMAAASEAYHVAVNGMSMRARNSGYANSAILVGVNPSDFGGDILSGIEFQRKWESAAYAFGDCYSAPSINSADFVRGIESSRINKKTTYSCGVYTGKFFQCLPEFVTRGMIEGIVSFGKKIKGFDTDGVIVGVETRSSAPLRIVRDDMFMSNVRGLYPCGEGAGYAGGITSAAVDGIKVAKAILEQLCK